ncbi:MAG: hypothetical protein ACOC1X_02745 [Promethearchaeota archaeon]
MEKIACVLFVFDRPKYLSQVLFSLEKQTFNMVDWFAYVDGNKLKEKIIGNTKGKEQSVQLLTNSTIQFKEIFINEKNKGIGQQKLSSHKLYSDYDTILFFEDDMIVSKHYIEVLLHLKNQYPEYEFITACDRPSKKTERMDQESLKNQSLDKLIGGGIKNISHFWGYYLSKRAVELLREPLEKYCAIVGEDYRNRSHKKIREVFKIKTTSHDGILNSQLERHKVKRIGTKVPRGRYIGKIGVHCTENIFKNFHKKEYEFTEEPFRYDSNN